MPISTVSRKGQVTIPKEIRKALGLRPGDRLDLSVNADLTLRLRPLSGSDRRQAGLLRRGDLQPPSAREIEETVIEQTAAEDDRIWKGETDPLFGDTPVWDSDAPTDLASDHDRHLYEEVS